MKKILLKPRCKLTADYPGCILAIGDILTCEFDDGEGNNQWAFGKDQYWDNFYPHLYPANFQPLQWWEERKLEEMPEYLNCPSRKMFFKVERWHKSYFIIDGRQKMQYGNYLPATKEEYESYINKNNSNE